MKDLIKKTFFLIMVPVFFISILSCSADKKKEPWREEYEKIVSKYEKALEHIEKNSEEYSEKITEFNMELLNWSKKWQKKAMEFEPVLKEEVSEKLNMLKDKIKELNSDDEE